MSDWCLGSNQKMFRGNARILYIRIACIISQNVNKNTLTQYIISKHIDWPVAAIIATMPCLAGRIYKLKSTWKEFPTRPSTSMINTLYTAHAFSFHFPLNSVVSSIHFIFINASRVETQSIEWKCNPLTIVTAKIVCLVNDKSHLVIFECTDFLS